MIDITHIQFRDDALRRWMSGAENPEHLDDATFEPQHGRVIIRPHIRIQTMTISAVTPERWRVRCSLVRGADVIVRGIVGKTELLFERAADDDGSDEIEIAWSIELID